MKTLLSVILLIALAPFAAAAGEEDGDEAMPGLIPASGILIFYKSEGPLSFVTMTPKDVPADARRLGTVKGVSCQHGLSIPLAANIRATNATGGYGDGSFRQALAQMQKKHPEMAGIYDVRTDLRILSFLGLYRRLCTEVTARAFARP
ncbi:MAG: hypothetical protein A2V88_02880 [Elusimicrobia bacterium RBG_16_66_12]|nr:MAG: hypothetical protein A2V88_02880 [Elusimicrobia bacterium RBG_16_66_12]